jgi:hypothetical protein
MALQTARMLTTLLLVGACSNDDAPGDGGSTTDVSTTMGATVTLSTSTTQDSATEPTSDSTGTDGSHGTEDATVAADSTGGPPCPETHACVAVPEGWNGPAVLRIGTIDEPAAACPDGYPVRDDVGGSDLIAPPASCECSCGQAVGAACSVAATLRYYGDDDTCSGTPLSTEIFTACNPLPTVFAAGSHWVLDPVLVEGGACEAQASSIVEPAMFTTTASTCAGAALLEFGCSDEEVCAPRAGDEALCIWQDGDEGCPSGFEEASSFHRTIEDTRMCTGCSCGDPVGLCDDAFAYLFQNVCNPPVAAAIIADGECHASSQFNTASGAAFLSGTPSAFCAATDASASGEAVGGTPVTVCCN